MRRHLGYFPVPATLLPALAAAAAMAGCWRSWPGRRCRSSSRRGRRLLRPPGGHQPGEPAAGRGAPRVTEPSASGEGLVLPRGPRDTRTWYREAEPMRDRRRVARGLRARAHRPAGARPRVRARRLQQGAGRPRARRPGAGRDPGVRRPGAGAGRPRGRLRRRARAARRRRRGHRVPARGPGAPRGSRGPAAGGPPRRATQRARHDAELHAVLRPRARRVQPHARRRPPAVLHAGLDAGAARRGVRLEHRRAGAPHRPQPGRAPPAPAAAPALPAGWTATGTSSRGTSSGSGAGRRRPERAGRAVRGAGGAW